VSAATRLPGLVAAAAPPDSHADEVNHSAHGLTHPVTNANRRIIRLHGPGEICNYKMRLLAGRAVSLSAEPLRVVDRHDAVSANFLTLVTRRAASD
jgi:hypothetical protein